MWYGTHLIDFVEINILFRKSRHFEHFRYRECRPDASEALTIDHLSCNMICSSHDSRRYF